MKWPWTHKDQKPSQVGDLLTEMDESLLLIVDPEQLTNNLLSKLRLLVDVERAFVYLASQVTAPRMMWPVGPDADSENLPSLAVQDHLVLWFRSNRQPLFFLRDTEVMRYLGQEIQPFIDRGINTVFPLVSMDRLIGLLFLQLNQEAPQAISRIQALGRQAGLAFENALLFKERLHQNERMFRAEQLATMGQFAAGVAHELRNPLTAIRSTVQFLSDEFDPSSAQQALAQDVLGEVDRLNGIVEHLLTLARPTDSTPQVLDLDKEVREYLHFVEAQAHQQGVRIELCGENPLPALYCDPGELRQLLLNLVVNGIQAMPAGGALTVRAQRHSPDGRILLTVEDQGDGIPAELHEKVFEPFFTTKKEGTGLGLAICRTIARRYGGDIWIGAGAGSGTCVNVTLPTVEGT